MSSPFCRVVHLLLVFHVISGFFLAFALVLLALLTASLRLDTYGSRAIPVDSPPPPFNLEIPQCLCHLSGLCALTEKFWSHPPLKERGVKLVQPNVQVSAVW